MTKVLLLWNRSGLFIEEAPQPLLRREVLFCAFMYLRFAADNSLYTH